jgi:hypothetical protein
MVNKDEYKYQMYDIVRGMHGAEFTIINIQPIVSSRGFGRNDYYQLRNNTKGCLDKPFWISSGILYSRYEPVNPAIKVLFDKTRG